GRRARRLPCLRRGAFHHRRDPRDRRRLHPLTPQQEAPMKLLRYGPAGHEKPGALDRDGRIRDLSGGVKDINRQTLNPSSLDRLKKLDLATLPVVSGSPRVGACVGSPSKVLAIGLNYRKHAEEAGMPIPSEPIFFLKATSSICGPNDDVIIPKGSQKTDYE